MRCAPRRCRRLLCCQAPSAGERVRHQEARARRRPASRCRVGRGVQSRPVRAHVGKAPEGGGHRRCRSPWSSTPGSVNRRCFGPLFSGVSRSRAPSWKRRRGPHTARGRQKGLDLRRRLLPPSTLQLVVGWLAFVKQLITLRRRCRTYRNPFVDYLPHRPLGTHSEIGHSVLDSTSKRNFGVGSTLRSARFGKC